MHDKIFGLATIVRSSDGTVIVAAAKSSRVVLYRLRATPLPYDGSRMGESSGYFEPVIEIDCSGNSCRYPLPQLRARASIRFGRFALCNQSHLLL